MSNDYPYLNFYRSVSYIVGVLAIIGGVIVIFQSLNDLGRFPFLSVVVTLALPFIAGISAIGTGDMLGLLVEMRTQLSYQAQQPTEPLAESIRSLTQEVRALKNQIDNMAGNAPAIAKPASIAAAKRVNTDPSSIQGQRVAVEVRAHYNLLTTAGGDPFITKSGLLIPVTRDSTVTLIGRSEDSRWYVVEVKDTGELWIAASALKLPDDMSALNALPVA